jgi:lysophospholipase L1-like esterase
MVFTEEDINNEIKQNGNTNLITNSGLESGSQIYAIGDSHTIFFYNSMKIKEHWFFGNKLPATIYRLINEDLDIYSIGTNLGNSHEKYNIKENDYVIFFMGFNDIQKNINKYASNRWQEEIVNLFTAYVNKVIMLSNKYNIQPIISSIYPNPLVEENVNAYGSSDERRIYTIFANNLLKNICEKEKIIFLNTYNLITDEYGFIKKEFTKDNIHLDYNNIFLRNYIECTIYNLIENSS